MRIRPASVSNPRTELQLNQRNRFGMVTRFLSSQRLLVNVGFRPYANGQTAFNAATSYNLLNAIDGTNPEVQIDYSKAMLSLGTLPPAEEFVAVCNAAGMLSLNWFDNSSDELASSSDALMIGLFDADSFTALTFLNCATRAEAGVEIAIPVRWSGRTIQIFAFFLSPKGMSVANAREMVSGTVYCGNVVLL